ncbi:MAG: DUF4163 domain-containing protein [Lachnospiraceae bacterium]|nr:DUF4163 domain-containing protein [Lachnospiraceae bacterium]
MSERSMSLLRRIAAFVLAAALVLGTAGKLDAYAAAAAVTKDPGRYNSNTYIYTVTDYSTRFTGKGSTIDVQCYYQMLQLPGKDKASKKINKILKNLAKGFDPDSVLSIAEMDAENRELGADEVEIYSDYSISSVTYNDGRYLSNLIYRYWYAGGVSNIFNDGYTFDLKTGKRAKITDVTGWSLKDIKDRIIANIEADGEFSEEDPYKEVVNGKKAADFNFYLLPGRQCVVTFAPYELGWGGWYREYIIEY